jgi:hypothetical protein
MGKKSRWGQRWAASGDAIAPRLQRRGGFRTWVRSETMLSQRFSAGRPCSRASQAWCCTGYCTPLQERRLPRPEAPPPHTAEAGPDRAKRARHAAWRLDWIFWHIFPAAERSSPARLRAACRSETSENWRPDHSICGSVPFFFLTLAGGDDTSALMAALLQPLACRSVGSESRQLDADARVALSSPCHHRNYTASLFDGKSSSAFDKLTAPD